MSNRQNVWTQAPVRTLPVIVGTLLLALLLTAILPAGVQAAEPELTVGELFALGFEAYDNDEYLDAARYLTAFIHQRPEALALDSAFAAEVEGALQYSIERLEEQLQCKQSLAPTWRTPRVSAPSQAGVAGKPAIELSATVHGIIAADEDLSELEPIPVPGSGLDGVTLPNEAIITPIDEVPAVNLDDVQILQPDEEIEELLVPGTAPQLLQPLPALKLQPPGTLLDVIEEAEEPPAK